MPQRNIESRLVTSNITPSKWPPFPTVGLLNTLLPWLRFCRGLGGYTWKVVEPGNSINRKTSASPWSKPLTYPQACAPIEASILQHGTCKNESVLKTMDCKNIQWVDEHCFKTVWVCVRMSSRPLIVATIAMGEMIQQRVAAMNSIISIWISWIQKYLMTWATCPPFM